jgi:hypothetical protein
MSYSASADPLNTNASSAATPARQAAAVTPSDSTDLTTYAKALFIGTVSGGSTVVVLPVRNADGSTVTLKGLSAGQIVPIQVRRVLSTGTTAADIVALFD